MSATTMSRIILHVVRADFLELSRRYRTLVTLGLSVVITAIVLPPATADYVTFNIGHMRGVYNSAWVSGVVTVFCLIIFWIPALLLVRGAIDRDRQTRVGEIIATTPMRGWQYTVGKMISNFVYLAALTGASYLAAVGMQVLRGEVPKVQPWQYAGPYLVLVLPVMALASATGVISDALASLGKLGPRVVLAGWGFLWMGFGGVLAEKMPYLYNGARPPAKAPTYVGGIPLMFHSMYGGAYNQGQGARYGMFIATLPGGQDVMIANEGRGYPTPPVGEGIRFDTFVWEGISWTAAIVLPNLVWLPVALLCAAGASLGFDRFDPARSLGWLRRDPSGIAAPQGGVPDHGETAMEAGQANGPEVRMASLSVAMRARRGSVLPAVVAAELRLMVRGLRWHWIVVAAGLVVAELLVPADMARRLVLPLAWAWPVAIWSQMGCRETRHNTSGIVLCAPFPVRRQLLAGWIAGVLVAAAMGGGFAIRAALEADAAGLLSFAAGALFIPSLALALGGWAGTSRVFEGVYLVWWYLGPYAKIAYLDFLCTTPDAEALGMSGVTLVMAGGLMVLALLARRRQLRA